MPDGVRTINQLLDDLDIAKRLDPTTTSSTRMANMWRPIAERVVNALVSLKAKNSELKVEIAGLRSEVEDWRGQYNCTEAHSIRLSQQLRNAGMVPIIRGRSSSRGRSPSQPGVLRRRRSDPHQQVRFEENMPSTGTANRAGERQPRSYHFSAEQLRRDSRADGEETREEFHARKKREFHAERDRLAKRFNPRLRGPSNVHFPGFQPFTGHGIPRPPTTRAPPPVPAPPAPIQGRRPHDIPSPYDPLRRPQDVPPRHDALPPELYSYVMRGGSRDIFGRVHSRR